MVISVASYKGGVAKTTTAVHIAAYLQQLAPTLLLDGDLNRSALNWAAPGKLPFKVVDNRQAPMYLSRYEHVVVDTEARPNEEDMKALAGGCDLLILPTTPDAMPLNALHATIAELRKIGARNYRVLLTVVPPRPNRDGEEAHQYLTSCGYPLFDASIRRLVAFQRAPLEGVTVDKIDRHNLGWADYAACGDQIIGLAKQQVA